MTKENEQINWVELSEQAEKQASEIIKLIAEISPIASAYVKNHLDSHISELISAESMINEEIKEEIYEMVKHSANNETP